MCRPRTNRCCSSIRPMKVGRGRVRLPIGVSPLPNRPLTSDEMIALVQAALRGVDRTDREAFLLYGIEGFSLNEIAAITGRHTEAVRESVQRARDCVRSAPSIASEFHQELLRQNSNLNISVKTDIFQTIASSVFLLRSVEMMTRDEIRELAAFQADESKGACALSFYFQPDPPQDRSHRREAIVAKDVVKQALKSAAAAGKNGSLHADLDRVLESGHEPARPGPGKSCVRLLCSKCSGRSMNCLRGLGSTQIYLQPHFQLKPLAALARSAAHALRCHGRPAAGSLL